MVCKSRLAVKYVEIANNKFGSNTKQFLSTSSGAFQQVLVDCTVSQTIVSSLLS